MTVFIGNDHGGIELKNAVVKMLTEKGYKVCNLGTDENGSVDYPDYGFAVAEKVVSDEDNRGIVICKSGVGMSMCANKVKGARCALCFNAEMGRLCREHNNANMLALGAGNTDIETALGIVDAFMSTEFAGGRHALRVDKITAYEANNG